MKKTTLLSMTALAFAVGVSACSGSTDDASGDGDGGDGDGTLGDGDGGDGDHGDGDIGDGDGDSGDGDSGTGGSVGDGDGDSGTGGITGDGDGDSATGGFTGDGDGDGDGVACTDEFVFGLSVIVKGGATGGWVNDPVPGPERPVPATGGNSGLVPPVGECGAKVVAVDGNHSEELTCNAGFPDVYDCTCYGAGERPGTYTVTATLGEAEESQMVTVTSDACHVKTESLTFFDSPTQQK